MNHIEVLIEYKYMQKSLTQALTTLSTDNMACFCWDHQSLLDFFWDVGVQSSAECQLADTVVHRRSPLEQDRLEVARELIFVADDQKLLKKLVSTHTQRS